MAVATIEVTLSGEVKDAIDEIRNTVYRERDELVAFLTRRYPSHLSPATDATDGWEFVVCVHGPTGQMAWHVPDEEAEDFFFHLPVTANDWDGHTTEEKYARLRSIDA